MAACLISIYCSERAHNALPKKKKRKENKTKKKRELQGC
jgi:hypothetical protein